MRRGWLLGIIVALILGGCAGGSPVRLFPPGLSVAEIRLDPERVVALLRLRSYATVPLRVSEVRGTLWLGDAQGIPIDLRPDLVVAANSTEPIELSFTPPADLREHLRQRIEQRRAVDYRIEARVRSSDPATRFDVEYRSTLAPAPGLPGVLR